MKRITAESVSNMLGDWSSGAGSLPEKLARDIGELLVGSMIAADVFLPSQRDLASALGTSRTTVAGAYNILASKGLLDLRQSARARTRGNPSGSGSSGRLSSFSTRTDSAIDLSSGSLPGSGQVTEAFLQLSEEDIASLIKGDGYLPFGLPNLRREIASDLTSRGIPTSSEQILVTSGSQQATLLCAMLFLSHGDTVLLEDPTYRGAIEVFKSLGVDVVGISMDENGAVSEHLSQLVRIKTPHAVYLQPTAHNPTGIVYSPSRFHEVAVVLKEHSIMLIEDLCSADLLFGPHTGPVSFAKMVEKDRLLTIGTASKLWWGGLRVGWIRAVPAVIRSIAEIRKTVDLSGAPIEQMVCANLFPSADQARSARQAELRLSLASTMELISELHPSWTVHVPKGGTGLWIDTHTDATRLSQMAKRNGIQLVAGPAFSVYGGFESFIRLPIIHDAKELRTALLHI